MCYGIYVNGICLNVWDLVKIEIGVLDFFFPSGPCVTALVVQEKVCCFCCFGFFLGGWAVSR